MKHEQPYNYLIDLSLLREYRSMNLTRSLLRLTGWIFLVAIGTTASGKVIRPQNFLPAAQPSSMLVVPEMKWILLPAGSNGSCVSNTNCCANTFCYGLEYTPENTGELTPPDIWSF